MLPRRITIRTNILTNILLVVTIVAAALIGLQYYFAKQMALEATEKTFHQLADKVTAVMQARDTLAKETLMLMRQYPDIAKPPTAGTRSERVRLLSTPMRRNNNVYAVYVGYGNGDLFEVVNLESDANLRRYYRVPAAGRWMVIKVMDHEGRRIRRFDFFDDRYRRIGYREEPSDYSVNTRPWYTIALGTDTAVRSDPYLFYNLQKPGITFSKSIGGGKTVLALDFTLETIDDLLKSLKFSPSSEIAMFGSDGKVYASSDPDGKRIDGYLEKALRQKKSEKILRYAYGGESRLAMLMPLSREKGSDTWLGFSVSEAEMMAPYLRMLSIELAAGLIVLLLMLPLVRFTTSRIVHPIYALMDETLKVKRRRFDDVRRIETNIIELDRLSRSLVDMAGSIREYQASQKRLLDSFIKLIADAIDAKSPYTGGHCKRVPVIAEMLAKEASRREEGAFAEFRLEGEEAWEEFERGAWLHDCGKITTPEYVVDKATKLETIYNRIHEIRTRFEVIRRDIEIEYFTRLIAGEAQEKLEVWMREEHQKLVDDFEFIAAVNLGGESMSESDMARVREIGSRVWIRHFDERAGLSENELMQYKGIAERPVPCAEKLLDDKPEHRIRRSGFDAAAYRAQGFRLEVPDLLYHRGELHNLCVAYGTLTPEERFKIQEHVIMTIRMLETLPLPDNMKRIPEYAGTHHETLDGTGYPRKLEASQLSVAARIMAIADIFEALTASDRPYKKAKSLSQSLAIMARMAKQRHIDAELFALFLRSGIYQTYAQRYLKPEQVDEVDIEKLLKFD